VIPVIAVGFCLLFGLLLWFVIGSRGRWTVKLAAIAASSVFTFMVWDALDTFSGWPTQQSPPERALLVSSTVDEPRAIYVWLVPSNEPRPLAYRADEREPRSYRLPYSRQLHAQVDVANTLARQGRQVEIRRVPSAPGDGRTARIMRVYALSTPADPRKHLRSGS
jgi:hypothetical protein